MARLASNQNTGAASLLDGGAASAAGLMTSQETGALRAVRGALVDAVTAVGGRALKKNTIRPSTALLDSEC